MPILSPFADREEPLGQGDLLKDVQMVFSDAANGDSRSFKETMALVISRDCVACRDAYVTVCPVKRWTGTVPREQAADDLVEFLEDIRDGVASPDILYLGSLENGNGERYQAQLGVICTILLPSDEAKRKSWVREHRLARLESDFVRSLPVRLFQSIAKVGFDDHAWHSTPDLEWVVTKFQAALDKLTAAITEKKAEKATAEASDPSNASRHTTIQREIDRLTKDARNLSDHFAPFRSELARRRS
jgi:hypothetical protein